MTKREKDQLILKVQKLKIYERISRGKGIMTNVNIEEINEGYLDDEIHDNIGGGNDDDSIEET